MLYLHNIFNGFWMIDGDYAGNFLPLIANYILGNKTSNAFIEKAKENFSLVSLASSNTQHFNSQKIDSQDVNEGSIAVIPIRGAITKHDQFCGPAGMNSIANLLDSCYSTDNIKGVLLVVESGGGEAYAMRILNDAISRRNKPVIAFIDDLSASAAYGIISGCDHIVANSELARIGSIGTYQTIIDHTQYFKNAGINIIEIYATDSKDKNSDFKEALNGNFEPLRKTIDVLNNSFLGMIENNRGDKLTKDRSEWGTGKVYFAKDALSLGLIDQIDSFENVLNYF